MGCNYLSLPGVPASGSEVLIYFPFHIPGLCVLNQQVRHLCCSDCQWNIAVMFSLLSAWIWRFARHAGKVMHGKKIASYAKQVRLMNIWISSTDKSRLHNTWEWTSSKTMWFTGMWYCGVDHKTMGLFFLINPQFHVFYEKNITKISNYYHTNLYLCDLKKNCLTKYWWLIFFSVKWCHTSNTRKCTRTACSCVKPV